ncbi:MAG TPA: bifunctional diaminohydroxyphosphoribosylaminopyrimidine deaminase/5-amino-6-(5-phosphoribosylamino)uracil reductase RibD [Woeseiaceae bacterium]|nr:bifunctional diaminohydroxyphosphoribosylaminopyrimidine deaminase/5-amino-6-(5-phosphoribosylamino)uracil reductase RibD [Woeseiaceae bacterium]
MARALRLASNGKYSARPNPMVGCVLVRGGEVIGEGWHAKAGEPHAEINALAAAGDARGATAYITLEPCVHQGRTPPCTDALLAAGVAELVVAAEDPYSSVNGKGIARLRAAGMPVRVGLMDKAAKELNRGFFRRVQTSKPFVRTKVATSIDGAVAMRSGESQWITGVPARVDVQRLRAASGAILTGIGTVLADDPSLTVRDKSIRAHSEQPLRAIVDSKLRMPHAANMLCLPGQTVIYCVDDTHREALQMKGAEIVRTAAEDELVSLAEVLTDLARRGINDLLVEAGPALLGSFVAADLVDELVIYQAPHIMGSETVAMLQTPAWTRLSDRRQLEISDVRRLGADTRITARFVRAC